MYVKIMAGDNIPDTDPKKCFTLYADVDLVNFLRDKEGGPEIEIINGGQITTVKLTGNVYCLGDMGANIAVFAVKDDDLFYDSDEVEIF